MQAVKPSRFGATPNTANRTLIGPALNRQIHEGDWVHDPGTPSCYFGFETPRIASDSIGISVMAVTACSATLSLFLDEGSPS